MSIWKFGILSKIMLASAPALLIFGGFCAYSTYTFSQLMDRFATVNAAWKEAAVAAGNENSVLGMRSDVGRFLTTSSEQAFKAAMQRAQQIGDDLARNESGAVDDASRELASGARAALGEFTSGLNELAKLQAERSRVLRQAIIAPASAIDKILA